MCVPSTTKLARSAKRRISLLFFFSLRNCKCDIITVTGTAVTANATAVAVATTTETMFTKSLSTDMDIEFDIKLLATGYSEGTVRFRASIYFRLFSSFFLSAGFSLRFRRQISLEINQTKIIGNETLTRTSHTTTTINAEEKIERGNHAHDDQNENLM